VQSAPAVQETQVPVPSQTWFVPQIVPAVTGVVVCWQTEVPVAQLVCEVRQALPGVQSAPAAHGVQLPW
jgi:hypothetical protein